MDAVASGSSFNQCILIIVRDVHHNCGYLSSFSKPFYTWENAQVMRSQWSDQLSRTEMFPKMQDFNCYSQENPGQVG